MSEYLQFGLLAASLVYFWSVMFDRFSRSCTVIGGVILIGAAGMALKPIEDQHMFEIITLAGFSALLLARSWLIWKDWYDGQ